MNHINERPFICNTCGQGFKTNQKLKIHKMIHTNESIQIMTAHGWPTIEKEK